MGHYMMTQLLLVLLLLSLWTCFPVPSAALRRSSPQASPPRTRRVETQDKGQPSVLVPGPAPELAFLADVVGGNRLWIIAAPSHDDHYLRMMEKQVRSMEAESLACRLAARETLILTIIHNAMMEGTLRRPSAQGGIAEESLDPDTVSKLVHHLELPERTFSMALLKKNLQVSERFPYAVRVEAVLEAIDQLPLRKLERLSGRAPRAKCKVLRRKGHKKGFIPLEKSGITQVIPRSHKTINKQAVLRSKVQDILNGRSRFVIRKGHQGPRRERMGPAGGATNKHGTGAPQEEGPSVQDTAGKAGETREGVKLSRSSGGEERPGATKPAKKGKSRKKDGKRKKGKGREKKAQRDVVEKEGNVARGFLEKLRGKRRLLVISAPGEDAPQLRRQRAENKRHACELAVRMVSVVTILGPANDATLSLQYYTTVRYNRGAESSQGSVPEESTNQELISQLRRDYGLHPHSFSVLLTDYDLRSQKVFDTPVAGPVLMAHIDSLPSRQPDVEKGNAAEVSCSWLPYQGTAGSSLLRFVAKRRLLIVSAPSEDDYSFQQQLQALSGQACPLGIRHFALLKLVGEGPSASGSLELFPLNGKSQAESEALAHDVVNGMREQLKISPDHFSTVVVGKSGEVEAWFLAPMWSLTNIYDLVDSKEERQQEKKLQSTLGIHCPEEGGSGTEGIPPRRLPI